MQSRDWDGGQDERGASSFTSYMRIQSSDSLWEWSVVCRRKNQLRRLWFPVRMSSFFCVRLWHCESCSDHTRTQASPWTWHTYTHADIRMQMLTFIYMCTFLSFCTDAHIFNKIMWLRLFFFFCFLVINVPISFLICLNSCSDDGFFPVATSWKIPQ